MERLQSEDGAGLVEYALLITLIVIVAFLAVAYTGDQTSQMWSDISSGLNAAG
jgi:Flp pilus assembly pilin Flp